MAYKVSADVVKASKALCAATIRAAGGPSAIANSLDANRQFIQKYIKMGYVPLKSVYTISSLIEVPPWCLSYYKFAEALGEYSPSFKKILREAPIPSDEKHRIFSMLK